jgi:hypothetical protein
MDCDGCGAEVKVEVALNAPPEANAIAHWGVVAQSGGELSKFSEELVLQPKPMNMPCLVLEVGYIFLRDFEVESFLALLL